VAGGIMKAKLADSIHYGLHFMNKEDSIHDVVLKMIELNIGAMVIGTKERVEGIFSERDLMKRVFGQNFDPKSTPIEAVMTKEVIVITENEDPLEVLGIFRELKIRHLLVVDEKEQAVGMLGMRDLMDFMLSHLQNENEALGEVLLEKVSADLSLIRG